MTYQLDWNIDVSKYIVAIASYGGPVGKIFDSWWTVIDFFSLLAVFPKGVQRKKSQEITIYSQSGAIQSTIPVSVFFRSAICGIVWEGEFVGLCRLCCQDVHVLVGISMYCVCNLAHSVQWNTVCWLWMWWFTVGRRLYSWTGMDYIWEPSVYSWRRYNGGVRLTWWTSLCKSHSKGEVCVCVPRSSCRHDIDRVVLHESQEVREDRVLQCKFFHTLEGSAGFAVMTNSYNFFVVGDSDRSKDDIRVSKLATLPCKWLLLD